MKKVIAIFAIATLVACNSGASTEATAVDSTAKVDSVKVDSVAATVDTTATPEVK